MSTNTKTTETKPAETAQEARPPSAAELLTQAAEALERRRAPRSPKHYKLMAEKVRALIPQAE